MPERNKFYNIFGAKLGRGEDLPVRRKTSFAGNYSVHSELKKKWEGVFLKKSTTSFPLHPLVNGANCW